MAAQVEHQEETAQVAKVEVQERMAQRPGEQAIATQAPKKKLKKKKFVKFPPGGLPRCRANVAADYGLGGFPSLSVQWRRRARLGKIQKMRFANFGTEGAQRCQQR